MPSGVVAEFVCEYGGQLRRRQMVQGEPGDADDVAGGGIGVQVLAVLDRQVLCRLSMPARSPRGRPSEPRVLGGHGAVQPQQMAGQEVLGGAVEDQGAGDEPEQWRRQERYAQPGVQPAGGQQHHQEAHDGAGQPEDQLAEGRRVEAACVGGEVQPTGPVTVVEVVGG